MESDRSGTVVDVLEGSFSPALHKKATMDST